MRQHWPIPAVALAALFCATYLLAGQDNRSARDRRILQIQHLIEEHNLGDAEKLLNEAAKQFPADAGFDNLRGIIQAQQGNSAAAERSFSRAIQRSPRFTGAYLNLGRLYQENSASDPQASRKALETYARVLDYEPRNEEASYQTAALLLQQGKFQESLVHLSRLPEEIQGRSHALSISCADYVATGNRKAADDAAARLLADPEFSEGDAQQILSGAGTGKRRGVRGSGCFR